MKIVTKTLSITFYTAEINNNQHCTGRVQFPFPISLFTRDFLWFPSHSFHNMLVNLLCFVADNEHFRGALFSVPVPLPNVQRFPFCDSPVTGSCLPSPGPWLPRMRFSILLPVNPDAETTHTEGSLCVGILHSHVAPKCPGLWGVGFVHGGPSSSGPCACCPCTQGVAP